MMHRALGYALVGIGILLLIFGISSADSFASDVSRFFTGEPTDRAMWLIIGGAAALIMGATLAMLPGRRLRA